MHKESFDLMQYFVENYLDKNEKLNILDIGSYDVNGCYKMLFQNKNWEYFGLDMVAGPNVDIVSKSPYDFGLSRQFDVIVSGNVLEHVESPWKWINEVARVLKKDGLLCVITPFSIGEHRFPLDCWRILPDGYKYLLEKESVFRVIETKLNIPAVKYRYFSNRPKLKWVMKLFPSILKELLEYTPTQDTYAIARKD